MNRSLSGSCAPPACRGGWPLAATLVALCACACLAAGCDKEPARATAEAGEDRRPAPQAQSPQAIEEASPESSPDPASDAPATARAEASSQTLRLGDHDAESGLLSPEAEAGTFRLAIAHRPLTLDPALVTDANSAQIVLNTYEGLMSYDVSSGPVVPGVAERYEVSDEGRTYTFELRKDARWSNGDPVTAFDFEYAWRRVLDPSLGSEYAWIMTDAARIKGAREYHEGRGKPEAVGITALDRHRLEVRLEVPIAHFVEMTALFTFAPLHRATVEAHPDGAWMHAENWVSNGPYVLVSHRDERQFVLRKNPEYHSADEVALERVAIRVIEGDEARLDAFAAGLVDWTGPTSIAVPPRQRERLEFEYHQDPFLAVEYLAFNTRQKPLDDARVREAIALAIDRQELVVKVLEGVGRPAGGFVPPLPGFRSQIKPRTDVRRARALVHEARLDASRVARLRYLVPRGNSAAAAMAALVQDQLRSALGLAIEIVEVDPTDQRAVLASGEFAIARLGWGADYISPSTFLSLWASASQQNYTGWSSPTYDALLSQASRTIDRVERMRLYEQAELLLHQDMPVSPLVYHEQTYVLSQRFAGFEPHVLSIHLLKYLRLAPPP